MTVVGVPIRWQWRSFQSLSTRELYAVMAAREAVFIVEQNCPYQDADGLDADAAHLIGWDGDVVAAYLRVLAPQAKFMEPSIGRVLVAKGYRGTGAGREAMLEALRFVPTRYPRQGVRISAQAYLERFYTELGFVKQSEPYLEDNIPHIEMLWSPSQL